MKVFLGRDAHGRKKYRSQVVRGGKRDANAVLLEKLQERATGTLTPRSRMTLRDLASEWAKHKEREVAPRTLRQYVDSLNRYVLPSLGHRKIADLTLREIDRAYGNMLSGELPKADGGPGVTGRPLAAGTVRLTHAALSQALSQAVRWGLIRSNPAAEASVPSLRAKEKETLTATERARWLDVCEGRFYGTFYRLLVDTGLRPGEACALTWSDVDFARGTISVRRTVTKGSKGKPVIGEPKTDKSRRIVPMLRGLQDALLRHQDWQRERALDADGLVFKNQDGEMLRPWTFSVRDFRRSLRAAGITKELTLYSLRHTFATLHVANGTSLKKVSDLLGHANIQQTANTYMHDDLSVTTEWMKRYERMLDEVETPARPPAN
ncbi:MAG: tyrosine-type recombinase/integrase [Trueperaceae bacterium]|nr:tyrosine-type recombinase/integrase [Trueperaceae bacterium]